MSQAVDIAVARSAWAGLFSTTDQMWRLADRWYRDRAAPQWRRRTAQEAELVFREIGLSGEFWKLSK